MNVFGLCLGGNVFGWTADRDASFAVLDAYVEAGGNFIDTADTYMRPNMGISETIIGEWMAARGNRDSLVIATKVGSDGGLSAANIAAHVDESLERLQTDRIDLYYAHKDDGSVPVEETVRAFDALVREGKVLHVAMSNTTGERLAESLRARRARGPGAATSGCSRTTTSSSATATSASSRRSSSATGWRSRPTTRWRAASSPASTAATPTATRPRAERASRLPRRARPAGARRARRDRRRARRRRRRGRDRLAAGQAGRERADRQRPHARAARRRPPRRRRCS